MIFIIVGKRLSGKEELQKELENLGWKFAGKESELPVSDAIIANPDELKSFVLNYPELVFSVAYIRGDENKRLEKLHDMADKNGLDYDELVMQDKAYFQIDLMSKTSDKMAKHMKEYLSEPENCNGYYLFENHYTEGENKDRAMFLDSHKHFFDNMRPVLHQLVANGNLLEKDGKIITYLEGDENPHYIPYDTFSATLMSDDTGMALCMRNIMFQKDVELHSESDNTNWNIEEYIRNIAKDYLENEENVDLDVLVSEVNGTLTGSSEFLEMMDSFVGNAINEVLDRLKKEQILKNMKGE